MTLPPPSLRGDAERARPADCGTLGKCRARVIGAAQDRKTGWGNDAARRPYGFALCPACSLTIALSGGIDSLTLLAAAAKVGGRRGLRSVMRFSPAGALCERPHG